MDNKDGRIINFFCATPIENLVRDQKSLSLSRSYHKYDNVEVIDIAHKDDGVEFVSEINILGQKFTSKLYADYAMEKMTYWCSCPWCNVHSMCGHIGASILKLEQLDIQSIPFHYENVDIERRIEEELLIQQEQQKRQLRRQAFASKELIEKNKNIYKTKISTLFNDEKYTIEPVITIERNNTIFLSFKIGLDKKYIIKNIEQFITDIDENNEHMYGKNLSFIHSLEAFDELSQKQIQLIKVASRYYREKRMRDYYSYYSGSLQKRIEIKDDLLDIFYDTYQDFDFDNLKFNECDEKIDFSLETFDDHYVLTNMNYDDFHISAKNLYRIKKKRVFLLIERIQLDDNGKTLQLLNTIEEDTVVIVKEDYAEFYKYVLQPIIDYIDVKGIVSIQDDEYVAIKIYGDIDEESQMYLKVYYINEKNERIQGFSDRLVTNYQQDIVEEYITKYAAHIDKEQHTAYFDLDSEKTHEFIYEGIDKLKEYAEIYISDALRKIGQTTNYNISIGVRVSVDLLSLEVECPDIPKKELSNVLAHYKKKKKFYRLKSGELLLLNSPELEELDQFMDQYHIDSKDIENGHLELSKNRIFSIDDDADNFEHLQIERNNKFKETIDKFNDKNQNRTPIPHHYDDILRDYQKEGYSWMETLYQYGFNGILADDMGLGKTLQVITLIEAINSKLPSLVVCPSSLIYNWEDEVHKFSKQLSVGCIVGNQESRKEMIANISNYNLVVTSYDYIRRDYELYEGKTFEYIVLDEAQYIKNHKTKNAISVKKLKAKHKLALTGTPIENTLAELWSIMDFLMPQYLFNYHYFQKNYENFIIKNNDEEKINALKKLTTPFVLRRNKKEVLKELPEKIENTHIIPFNDEEKDMYYANLAQVNKELQSVLNMERVDKIAILAMLTRLRQLCCEPRLVYENIESASSKMIACLDLVANFKSQNQKVLIFSSFTSVLSLLEDELKLQGISYLKLTGATSKEERKRIVCEFQEGNADVFLISLKAGGTGLNLTMAEAVIHFDPWWNVSAQNQATDRAYRIGQHKNVQVYKLVMKGSIEEKIIQLQNKKKELADIFVENNSGSISGMSKEDIMDLFT